MTKDRISVGGGFYTNYQEDGFVPINAQLALNDYWEIGGKLLFDTEDNLESVQTYLDLGAKYRVLEYSTLEADILVGLDNNRGGGLVFSYAHFQPLSKIFSNLFEARIGFLDRVAGEGGYAKIALGVTPQFYFGKSVHAMIGVESSGSLGNLSDDFMMDIVPRLEVGILPYFHIMGELAIGILQEKNNNNVRTGIYAVMDF